MRGDRGAVSIISWFGALKSRIVWCIRTMSHGDVGVKNTIMKFLLHFYRRIICSPPIDLVPTEIVLPNTHKQGDGETVYTYICHIRIRCTRISTLKFAEITDNG